MKLLKYLCNKIILIVYALISGFFTFIIFFNEINEFDIKVFLIILLYFLILRVTDDIYDFKKDTGIKTQYLKLNELKLLNAILVIMCVITNVTCFKLFGLLSVIILLLIFLEKKVEFLEVILGPLMCFYIIVANGYLFKEYAILKVSLITAISIIYVFIKRRRKV